jgi:uncharacterized protein (TIGR02996 family)
MSADEQRLLEQIRANPADDQLRMLYADLLLARGDERGEYMQLALASENSTIPSDHLKRYDELQDREKAWAIELGCGRYATVRWNRGLPYALLDDADELVAHRDALRRLPIEELAITDQRNYAALAALPELALVEDLTLWGHNYPRGWGSKPRPPGLEEGPIPHDELAALGASPNLGRLRRLTVQSGNIDDSNASNLASACWFAQLEALTIRSLGGAGLAHLLARPLPLLRKLELDNCFIDERGGRAFADAELPALTYVDLSRAGLRSAGARLLFGSHNMASVERLSLFDDPASGACAVLAASPYVHSLRVLSLMSTSLGDADVIALATGSGFPALRSLGLSRNQIGDAGAAALASSSRFPALASLYLEHNRLTHDGALAFANRTCLPALTQLGLFGNPFPSGRTEPLVYDENQYVISGGDIPIPIDEIRALFAHRTELRVD